MPLRQGAVWPPIALPVAIGIGCSYLANLLADACTPHGAPLLGPISGRRVHLLPSQHRVGFGEVMMLIIATLASVALGVIVLQAR